jgi:hypothetical protein
MDKAKPSLVVPILINMTKVKSIAILTILESSKPPSKYAFHFLKLCDEMFKTTQKNVKRTKAKGIEFSPLES